MIDSQSSSEKAAFVALVKFLINLLLLVLPFVIPVYLPPPLIVLYWLLTYLVEWVENRVSGVVDHTIIWMLGGCFGMSGLVAENVPGPILGTLAGVVCFFFLLVVHEGWKKLAKLEIRQGSDGPRIMKVDPLPLSGPNAWNGAAPNTPEGERVRVLSITEIVMGGPTVCDYLLPDGSVIFNGGASSGFSPNGRYFVTPAPSRNDWPLMIYDRRRRLLHTCDVGSKFWEIDLVGDMTISGRESPLVSNQSWTAMIDDLIAHSRKQNMVEVADLKVPQKHWDHIRKRHKKTFPDPPGGGGPSASWALHLPKSLKALENPLDPLLNPQGEITVSGDDSRLMMSLEFPVIVWRNDGRAFVCEATPKGGGEKGWWLWDDLEGWKQLRLRQNLSTNIPYGQRRKLADLDTCYLAVEWELLQPSLGEGNIGELNSYTGCALEIAGQMFEQPTVHQVIPLAPGGNEDERVDSAPLKNGHNLIWCFLRIDEDISRHVYRCEFKGRPLQGEWLLDHRISVDGRYVALVAYAAPPVVPHSIAIFDSETGKLNWVKETFFFPELQGFGDERLYLVHVTERRVDALPDGLDAEVCKTLRKPNEAMIDLQITSPPSDHSRTFMRHDNQTRFRYQRTLIVFENGEWRAQSPVLSHKPAGSNC